MGKEFKAIITENLKYEWLIWCAKYEGINIDLIEKAYNTFGEIDKLHDKYAGEIVTIVKEDYYFIKDDNNFVIPEHLFKVING